MRRSHNLKTQNYASRAFVIVSVYMIARFLFFIAAQCAMHHGQNWVLELDCSPGERIPYGVHYEKRNSISLCSNVLFSLICKPKKQFQNRIWRFYVHFRLSPEDFQRPKPTGTFWKLFPGTAEEDWRLLGEIWTRHYQITPQYRQHLPKVHGM